MASPRSPQLTEARSSSTIGPVHDLATRGAPLEYWFWKVNTPTGGAIIDFVVRRSGHQAQLRVSTWDDGVRPVIHEVSSDWETTPRGVRIGPHVLDASGSRGAVDGVQWAVEWDLGSPRLLPRPSWFGPLHPFDMELVVRPSATIRGTVAIDGRKTVLDGSGGVAHYWGRRLPSRWAWISATGFDDDPDARLEALLVSSRMWGRGPGLPAGYVWVQEGPSADGIVMPLTGVIRSGRTGHRVTFDSLRVDGRRHTLMCSADRTTFNDAGEGIEQSMTADLLLDGRRRSTGTVGLEFRG